MGPVKYIQERLLVSLRGVDSFLSVPSTKHSYKPCKYHYSQPKDNPEKLKENGRMSKDARTGERTEQQ